MLNLEKLPGPLSSILTLSRVFITADLSEKFIGYPEIKGIDEEVGEECLGWHRSIVIRLVEIEEYLGINNDVEYVIRYVRSEESDLVVKCQGETPEG